MAETAGELKSAEASEELKPGETSGEQERTEMSRERELAERFERCGDILTAIGDETRQHMIVEMMKMGKCTGVRVGEITAKTNLSRPAVSHHLQILKNAGMLKVRKEATMNFYYFDSEMEALKNLVETLQLAIEIASDLPDRRCQQDMGE